MTRWSNSCAMMSRNCSVWDKDDNKGGWLDPELCAKARREEVEYFRRHNMYERGLVGIRDSTKQRFRVENTSTHSVLE